jgi:hypothetical protein
LIGQDAAPRRNREHSQRDRGGSCELRESTNRTALPSSPVASAVTGARGRRRRLPIRARARRLQQRGVKNVGEQDVKAYGNKNAKASVPFGYVQAQVMNEILTKACSDKDLSREGLIKAAHELSGVQTGGLVAGPLDYTKLGQPSTRSIYIARPANVIGGLRPLPGTFESDTAKSYNVGAAS